MICATTHQMDCYGCRWNSSKYTWYWWYHVTSTAEELNILDGVTADKDDINLLDGTTAEVVVAGKVIAVDANKDISGFRNITATNVL